MKRLLNWLKKPLPLPYGKLGNLKPGQARIRRKSDNKYMVKKSSLSEQWWGEDATFFEIEFAKSLLPEKRKERKKYVIEHFYQHTFWREVWNSFLHIVYGYANCVIIDAPWEYVTGWAASTGIIREEWQRKRFKIQYRGIQILDVLGIIAGAVLWSFFPLTLGDYR